MQILQLDSSIQGDASGSRVLTAAIVDELLRAIPTAIVVRRDLVGESIAHLDGPIAAGFRDLASQNANSDRPQEHAKSEALVSELLASDVLVIGAPMYNFSVASQLKAWIDRVVQPRRTFMYTDKGPVPLTSGKRAIIASTRGGVHSAGPTVGMDFQEPYLRAVLGFIGITDVQFVRAERMTKGEEARSQALAMALGMIGPVVRQVVAA